MPVIKQGYCVIDGEFNLPRGKYIDRVKICPRCLASDICDVWKAEVSHNWQRDSKSAWHPGVPSNTIGAHGHSDSDVNIFPGIIPSKHQPVLFIFLDDPSTNKSDVIDYIKHRIREHIRGMPTEELHLVTQNFDSLMYFFGWKRNKQTSLLKSKWRYIDPTFAPRISFEDYNGNEIR